MNETFNLFQQIHETLQLLQQGLMEVERGLRGLTLAAAQTNAELAMQSRRINLMEGRLSRLEAALGEAVRR